MSDEPRKLVVIEGNSLRLVSQDGHPMQMAGSGEQQLWSMMAALGTPNDKAKDWMDQFIPPNP